MAKSGRFIVDISSYIFYRVMYITGLAAAIPIIFIPSLERNYAYLAFSILLILLSFFGLLRMKHSTGKALRSMGFMSLIPGTFAAVLFIFSKNFVYLTLAVFVPKFSLILPYLDMIIDRLVPKMGILVVSYLFIGSALYFIGSRLKK